jgi:sirohydrochlorin cobaltochelatase
MKAGLILFAHGARDPNWSLPFKAVCDTVRHRAPDIAVVLGYLEFMSPNLVDAGHELAAAGCLRIDIVPLFLGAGGHVRKDLPVLIETLRAAHPQVTWTVRSSIGEAPDVIDAMARASLAGLTTGTNIADVT